MYQEIVTLYQKNLPFIVRDQETVLRILHHKGNTIIEHREEGKKLAGVSVVNQNTILLLCVDAKYRRQGIGTKLLRESEETIRRGGYDRVVVGNGFDYIMPGVPTSKRYFPAENEELYPGLDETASDFFTKRGYTHTWNCNCFDMRFPLERFDQNDRHVGDTIEGVTYRWATPDDLAGICACTDDAFPEFTVFYQNESLYAPGGAKVLIAVLEGEIVGTLIVEPGDGNQPGSIGCTTVRQACRGRHIAVNLVTVGTRYLKDTGIKDAYLSYTYSGLDHLYGYAGYRICVYFMMAEKAL
ncbi:MAG: GNAT family N-acetyltransferase [bacterium]|nr:GNAT family N-acetyltransferase [bacterium]MCM1376476.1 GNAT family N-acetyltransferase [Muribaculum sp.]